MVHTEYRFDWLFVTRFWRLIRHMIPSNDGIIFMLLFFLLMVSLLNQLAIYSVGMISSAFYKILAQKDLNEFQWHLLKSLLYVVTVAFAKSANTYITTSLHLNWRLKLTRYMHEVYFHSRTLYHVNVLGRRELPNPDQRMTQDVSELTSNLSEALSTVIISPLIIAYYSYRSYGVAGWIGPMGCFLFFLVSSILNKFLMSPIVNLVYQQEEAEGFFRFHHMNVRSKSESISFLKGTPVEKRICNRKLNNLFKIQNFLMNRQLFQSLAVNVTDYLGSIVSFLILAGPLFAGKYDDMTGPELSELISQNAFISIYLISSFTQLVDLVTKISVIAGTTHRICQFIEVMSDQKLKGDRDEADSSFLNSHPNGASSSRNRSNSWVKRNKGIKGINYRKMEVFPFPSTETVSSLDESPQESILFRLKDLILSSPSGRILIQGLSLEISTGNNILIWGKSGCGKSSLIRCLRGLWKPTAGSIQRPSWKDDRVMFLPQKSNMTTGSFRQQLVYPHLLSRKRKSDGKLDDSFLKSTALTTQLLGWINTFHLSHLLNQTGDLDRNVDWSWEDTLSPGEMQRVSFIRVLVSKPKLVILDEATCSVSIDVEDSFYEELKVQGISFISTGHRESLLKHHDNILSITPSGSTSFQSIVSFYP